MNDVEENGAPAPSGKATASMVCGILSLVGYCVPFVQIVAPLLAIAGLVLGFMSLKAANKGFAIAGIITSVISLLLAVLALVGLTFLTAEMAEQGVTFDQMMEDAQQQMEDAEDH